MLPHRFLDLLESDFPETSSVGVPTGFGDNFVPCPIALDPAHQANVATIYRIAASRIQESQAELARARRYEFSMN